MRDPERIPKVLGEIEEIWLKNPDLRLMQLLGNLTPAGHDCYYMEEGELLNKLKETYPEVE